jgi:hypothetical protein
VNLFNYLFGRYRNHPETVIISCYFNPLGSEYRKKAFDIFYNSIKHLNHRVVECVIGDSKPQLIANDSISHVHTRDLLWHKETLLNNLVKTLPKKFKYVLWVDADVIFTNKNWMLDAAKELSGGSKIVQLFEYCVHLNKDEQNPKSPLDKTDREYANHSTFRREDLWKSFAAVHNQKEVFNQSRSPIYNVHGHVGFAWGARRSLLEQVPLYDKALIGGADHIIAHAAAGHIDYGAFQCPKLHPCIEKSFTDDLGPILDWSRKFMSAVSYKGLGFVKGDLYHIWHGDVDKRDYFQRIKNFTPKAKEIVRRDKNGFFVSENPETTKFMADYFGRREVLPSNSSLHHGDSSIKQKSVKTRNKKGQFTPSSRSSFSQRGHLTTLNDDGDFITSAAIAYATDSTIAGAAFGGNLAGAIIGDSLRDGGNGMRPDSNASPLSTPRDYPDDPKEENQLDNSPSQVDTDAQNCGNFS